MVSRLENFKFLNYNNGLRLGVGGGGPTKLYTPLRVRKKLNKAWFKTIANDL